MIRESAELMRKEIRNRDENKKHYDDPEYMNLNHLRNEVLRNLRKKYDN